MTSYGRPASYQGWRSCATIERETDERWIAEVNELPGVLAYGATQDDAISRVQALALRVVADRLENEDRGHEYLNITFDAA